MNDTTPEIEEKVRKMFQKKSPIERLKMGFSMHETSKYLVASAISEDTPVYSGADMRKELFLRFYGDDFDPAARQKILDHFGSNLLEPKRCEEEMRCDFEHIPHTEKKEKWWLLLYPLIQARLSKENPENSKLLSAVKSRWIVVKNSIETALVHVKNGERILARASEIKSSPDPDRVIDDMFGELRTVPYLLLKGFQSISYSRRDGLDFRAEFGGDFFYIESTYVHGPDFKTQEYVFASRQEETSPTYRIRPDKLVRLFESVYSRKRKQIARYPGSNDRSLIFMITDLEETHAPWLDHAKVHGLHPLLHLVVTWEIPVVIFGRGSVYEPHPDSLGGTFGKLQPFTWDHSSINSK